LYGLQQTREVLFFHCHALCSPCDKTGCCLFSCASLCSLRFIFFVGILEFVILSVLSANMGRAVLFAVTPLVPFAKRQDAALSTVPHHGPSRSHILGLFFRVCHSLCFLSKHGTCCLFHSHVPCSPCERTGCCPFSCAPFCGTD
jgi:hypothetical protein